MTSSKTVLVSTPTFGQFSPESRERLREYGCEFVELSREEAADRETLYAHLDGVNAWVVGYTEIDAAVFDRAPDLEVIAKHGTGVDNVDLDVARERGVVVANAPGANANGVAELVVLHALNYYRDVVGGDATVRDRRWESDFGNELAGRTLGVVGLGKIGQTVVERTAGFDLTVLAHDVADRSEFLADHDVEMVDDLQELLGRADVVTTHVPLTEGTRGLIGAEELAAMREDACVINTARGGIVDEDALVAALADDEIGGAALDVLESEPPDDADRYDALLADDRVTFTPHVGGRTEEAMAEISSLAARNVLNVFEGEDPVHRVV
jgi:D-3-phosphoglycerate dehydrogenase